ncbi:hypothetical protein OB955_08585 [Halobacteria archaeon AArc-m2/3/4]|uniref:Uncharacterized protein n=1 Tax=Natronoglomus mannanivorans TaxID=2979990 RepID=A0AAP3E147_9EURY|nr:hypothetical protein [Halobacteria archaeon AArc-xg1-1]MCU4972795.1 hypothetical protein [Halobacteria archaeon AArc-m2/3/4]
MSESKTRVDFNAPESLVERADVVSDLLNRSRTSLLVDALREQVDEIVTDETFRRRVKEAYYTGRIDFETLETIVGREEAMRIKLLGDSLTRDPPVPEAKSIDLPADGEFYDGELPTWTPDEDESDDDASSGR